MKMTKDSFVQLPFSEFVEMCPEFAAELRKTPFFDEFIKDPNYLVRLRQGKIEIGYTEDAWQIS